MLWGSWLGPFQAGWILLVAVPLAILAWLRRKSRRTWSVHDPHEKKIPWGVIDLVLFLALMLLLTSLVVLTFSLPLLDWDARILWAYKAKLLTSDGTVASDSFHDPYRLHIHPRYPLLLPWLAAFFSRLQGAFQELFFRLAVSLCGLLGLAVFYQLCRVRADRTTALLCCLVLSLTGSWTAAFFHSSVELVIFLYLMLALQAVERWLQYGALSELLLSGLLLAGGAASKNEGVLLAACLCLAISGALMLQGQARRAAKALPILIGVVFAPTVVWLMHLRQIPPVSDENYLARLDLINLKQGFNRVNAILAGLAREAFDLQQWHLIWILVPLLLLLAWRKGRLPAPGFFLPACIGVGYFAGLLMIYMISPWRDISLQIGVTFHRVMLPLAPLVLIAFLEIIAGQGGETAAGETDRSVCVCSWSSAGVRREHLSHANKGETKQGQRLDVRYLFPF